jgi:hypothetical protein
MIDPLQLAGAHGVPDWLLKTPQRLPEQMRVWQAVSLPGQSDAVLHWTQAPAPSQTLPPF